ncbi:hypothetical protein HX849_07630 [Marine Group I thaumarchaeote]|nr:hypothetical protein [Marine Group I thaumarchaeote]
MKQKYKEYLRLNKNILLAFAASITISAVVADYLSDQQDYLNSTLTLVADYCVFFSTFGILFYIDNRKKYRTETGELKKSLLKSDLIKIITSLGIAEVVYTIVRWSLQYYLLQIDYDAYLASIISQLFSTVVYLIVINLSVKISRLYKDDT